MEDDMFRRKFLLLLAALSIVVAFASPSRSQSNGDPLKACESQTATFDTWTACLIDKVATPLVNQRHPAKQVEVPSIADNTTSLVDQTSSPDLVGLALNLAGLKQNSDESNNGTSGTITTSAYALYAAAKNRDPLDPDFYMKHPNLRRYSFTFGRDGGKATDPNTNVPATVLGFKLLALNWRDIASHNNDTKLMSVSAALASSAVATLKMDKELQDFLFQELAPTLGLCGPAGAPIASPIANQVTFLNNCLGPALAATVA